jgi:hypothetical protein
VATRGPVFAGGAWEGHTVGSGSSGGSVATITAVPACATVADERATQPAIAAVATATSRGQRITAVATCATVALEQSAVTT